MFELRACLNSPFIWPKNHPFLMATTRASLKASCMMSLQKIPDNLNFNNSKKNKKWLIFATKANGFQKVTTSLFMSKMLGLASLAISHLLFVNWQHIGNSHGDCPILTQSASMC